MLVAREVSNKDFGRALHIAESHVTDVNMVHLFIGTIVAPFLRTFVVIPKGVGWSVSGMPSSVRRL